MQFKSLITFITLFIMMLGLDGAGASTTMRCGTKLIYTGDTKAEVLLKCGEPMFKDTVAIASRGVSRDIATAQLNASRDKTAESASVTLDTRITEAIDEWTYNLGKGRFLRILRFRGGVLESITDGERY